MAFPFLAQGVPLAAGSHPLTPPFVLPDLHLAFPLALFCLALGKFSFIIITKRNYIIILYMIITSLQKDYVHTSVLAQQQTGQRTTDKNWAYSAESAFAF